MSTKKIFLLYDLLSDLIVDPLLNENLNEDNSRELVLLMLCLTFGDNLDPPDYDTRTVFCKSLLGSSHFSMP